MEYSLFTILIIICFQNRKKLASVFRLKTRPFTIYWFTFFKNQQLLIVFNQLKWKQTKKAVYRRD